MTVGEMTVRMSAREEDEWFAYSLIEPFGESWRQTGVIAATVANHSLGRKKGSEPTAPEDFMPRTIAPEKPLVTDEQVEAKTDAIFGALVK